MQVHTFVAESTADAVAQIRETLGPNAVVLNVRRPPIEGLARLWQKPRIEVLAHVPEAAAVSPVPVAAPESLAELREELRELRQQMHQAPVASVLETSINSEIGQGAAVPAELVAPMNFEVSPGLRSGRPSVVNPNEGGWRIGALLENSGVLALHAQRVVEDLQLRHGVLPPVSVAEEIQLARLMLASRWRPAREHGPGPHIFIGAPGAGKTTVLCKWLAQTVLVEGCSAAVWRLDGHVANTAESLSVFGEILGVPVERCAPGNGEVPEAEVLFVDVPGVNPADRAALTQLTRRLATLPQAQVHLVLNAAYETPLLLAQARAFAAVGITDVIVTHLDEETCWGKLWNLVLGTNCTLRFLSAGQNIPGDFQAATAEKILARQFPRKAGVSAVPA